MNEYTLALVVIVLFGFAMGTVFMTRRFKREVVFDVSSTDYIITLWAERSAPPNAPTEMVLQKVSANYKVTFQADSPEEQRVQRDTYAQQARTDFSSRFTPLLGEFNIGALRFEPLNDHED
jgi:hypothetical protein